MNTTGFPWDKGYKFSLKSLKEVFKDKSTFVDMVYGDDLELANKIESLTSSTQGPKPLLFAKNSNVNEIYKSTPYLFTKKQDESLIIALKKMEVFLSRTQEDDVEIAIVIQSFLTENRVSLLVENESFNSIELFESVLEIQPKLLLLDRNHAGFYCENITTLNFGIIATYDFSNFTLENDTRYFCLVWDGKKQRFVGDFEVKNITVYD